MIKTFLTRTLSFLLLGEQVDLASFAPACLPALDQSFAGLVGRVAGENSLEKAFIWHLAGWGKTDEDFTSDNLREVEVGFISF